MCTRMLCPVQWNIGEKQTTCGSLSWRKENSASDWDRYPATTSATAPAGAAAVTIASYWRRSWPVIAANWVTPGRSPG
ncbi:MAG: hypothetical protein ACRDOH_07940 [Streptosporangiaceae bacterium]